MESGVELKPNTGDMAGDKDMNGTGEICVEKLILSSRSREWLRAQMVSNVS